MYLLVIFLPFFSFFTLFFFSYFFGSKGSSIISLCCMCFTVFLSFFILFEVGFYNSVCSIRIFKWFDCELLDIYWGFYFDSLTAVMLIVVNVVSFLVHLFSLNYMSEDPFLSKFLSYLSLFTFFMLMLITSDNFIQMFVGWEGVGLASYLLINFWHTRLQANKSALKAIIVNRVGDFGLVLGLASIFYIFGSLDFFTVFSTVYFFKDYSFSFFYFDINCISFISFFIFIGAVGKSAQLGLHTWLPDAMEGPTPVSALIHAATMVTAGVFVLIRCSPILEYTPFVLTIITIIGALTAFFAASTGLVQNDLKRVIAYSTCSQLGYMVFACGLSNYSVSLFHLMNHAFFKALLFLSAGAIIHALQDEQDMRRMGGLFKLLPFTYCLILIGSLSLMGFPFLTGFYSKDVILELAFARYDCSSLFAYWLGTLSAFFTAFYSFRLVCLTFFFKNNNYKRVFKNLHDAPFIMIIPLIILAFGSIFVGFLFKDMIIGLGTPFFGNSLFFLPTSFVFIDAEFLPFFIKILPVCFSIIGAVFSLYSYIFFNKIFFSIKNNSFVFLLYIFFNKKWFFDVLYFYFFIKPLLFFGYNVSFKLIDRGFIEFIGPFSIVSIFNNISTFINKSQTGFIYHYTFLFFVSVLFFLSLTVFDLNFLYLDERLFLILFIFSVYFFILTPKKNYL